MSNKIRTLTLLFILFTGILRAQNNCSDALYQANKFYELGNLKECVDRLEPCLNKTMNVAELEASYHLLAMAYFTLGNPDKVDFYIKKLLHIKPEYNKYPNIDPIDFRRVIEQYLVIRKLNLGLTFGLNITSISLSKSYSLFPSTQRYIPRVGPQFGVCADYLVWKSMNIKTNLMYGNYTINHIIDDAGGWTQDYEEQQNYIGLNLAAVKRMKLHQTLDWYAGIGVTLNYLTQSHVSIEATNIDTKTIQQATQNAKTYRNLFQPALLLVSGITMPLGKGDLGIDLGYQNFLMNTVDKEKRLVDLNFVFNNQYLNDDIKLRSLMFNISYKFTVLWKIQKNSN